MDINDNPIEQGAYRHIEVREPEPKLICTVQPDPKCVHP